MQRDPELNPSPRICQPCPQKTSQLLSHDPREYPYPEPGQHDHHSPTVVVTIHSRCHRGAYPLGKPVNTITGYDPATYQKSALCPHYTYRYNEAMESQTDRLASLFTILRQLRLRAGYTQAQIAAALGLRGKGNFNLISRLECGRVKNPSLRLILDFLRACNASLDDIKPFLSAELSEPLKVPERSSSRTRLPEEIVESPADLQLRKQAGYWKLQQKVEQLLHQELNAIGAPPLSGERQRLCLFGRKLFRILYDTRDRRAPNRQKRLERCRRWAQTSSLPDGAIARIEQAVTRLFSEMEQTGELDRLPLLPEARQLELLGHRHRFVSDYELSRQEMFRKRIREFQEQLRRRQLVEDAALRLLQEYGITGNSVGSYRGLIIGLVNACICTKPGTPERDQSIRLQLAVADPRFTERSVAERLAALIQANWDRTAATPGA